MSTLHMNELIQLISFGEQYSTRSLLRGNALGVYTYTKLCSWLWYFPSSAVIGPSPKNKISIRGALIVLPCSVPTLAASASASALASSCCVSHKYYSSVYSFYGSRLERECAKGLRNDREREGLTAWKTPSSGLSPQLHIFTSTLRLSNDSQPLSNPELCL